MSDPDLPYQLYLGYRLHRTGTPDLGGLERPGEGSFQGRFATLAECKARVEAIREWPQVWIDRSDEGKPLSTVDTTHWALVRKDGATPFDGSTLVAWGNRPYAEAPWEWVHEGLEAW